MEAITANYVPRMIQELYDHTRQEGEVEAGLDVSVPVSLTALPNARYVEALSEAFVEVQEANDKQRRAVALACGVAIEAILSHAKSILAAVGDRQGLLKQSRSINDLPTEILVLIFGLVIDTSSTPWRIPLYISHVSRLWRDIALLISSFWSRVDGAMSQPILDIYLARCGAAPLAIDLALSTVATYPVHGSTPRSPMARDYGRLSAFLYALSPHASRWQELVIHCPMMSSDMLARYLSFPWQAPQLRKFHASFSPSHMPETENEVVVQAFGGHTPSLRDLKLTAVCISLASPIYAGLTSLALTSISYPNAGPGDLLQALVACPLLETLQLSRICFSDPFHRDPSPPALPLPMLHLRLLSLDHLYQDDLQCIVTSIRVPSTLYFHVATRSLQLDLVLPPTESLAETFPNISTTRSMKIAPDAPEGVSIGVYCHSRDSEIFRFTAAELDGPSSIVTRVLTSLAHLHPLPDLESLSLENIADHYVDASLFSHTLGLFPSITSLSLSSCPLFFIEMLAVTPTSHLCPRLESLKLKLSTDLATLQVGGQSLSNILRSRTELGAYASLIRQRGGAYLTKLELCVPGKLEPVTLQALEALPIAVTVERGEDGED